MDYINALNQRAPISLDTDQEQQNNFFENLFPNRELSITEYATKESLEDRNDIIIKIQNDPSYCCEKQILTQKLDRFRQKLH